MFAVFIPRKSNFFTALLLDLNILVFILMSLYGASLMNPSADNLLAWGANYKPLTLAGEGWRLLTSCFVHIGVMHLLMNMYALLYIGYVLEPILGNIRFISAYIMTGLLASLNSLWWHDLSVSAGASGAIFGLYGVFLALLTTSIVEKSTRKPLFISIAIFIIYNLMNGLKEGVDNAAHIGGILSGIVIGYAFLPTLRNKTSKFFNTGILILLLTSTLILTAVALKRIPNYIGKYDYIMMQTFKNDSIALSIYDIADSMSTEEKLIQINNRAITPMQENILLMKQTDTMQLPPAIRYEIQLYKKYYQLRLSSFILYSKAIAEDTDLYNTQLNTYYHQIDSLTKKIH
jgi:rhomboid protease GluP